MSDLLAIAVNVPFVTWRDMAFFAAGFVFLPVLFFLVILIHAILTAD